MKKTISVPFQKFHALGNDFIVAGATGPARRRAESAWLKHVLTTPSLRRLAQAICARHTGIGADGFLLVEPARQSEYDAVVRFFNADGSEAEMSGNGIRCVGMFLMNSGEHKRPLRIKTLAGVKMLESVNQQGVKGMFRVRMGQPIVEPHRIPFGDQTISAPVVGYTLTTPRGNHLVTVTSMGNPHCSLFVESFHYIDWPGLGREIELHPLFPNRTNVEFVKVVSRNKIDVRFWERGVGITASSGTGSCAAAVASILNGFTDRKLRVETTAGNLRVGWPEGGELVLTGPAVKIAEGDYHYTQS